MDRNSPAGSVSVRCVCIGVPSHVYGENASAKGNVLVTRVGLPTLPIGRDGPRGPPLPSIDLCIIRLGDTWIRLCRLRHHRTDGFHQEGPNRFSRFRYQFRSPCLPNGKLWVSRPNSGGGTCPSACSRS